MTATGAIQIHPPSRTHTSRSSPKQLKRLPCSGRGFASTGPLRSSLSRGSAKVCQTWAEFGRVRPNSDQIRPNLAKVDHSANLDRSLADQGRCWPIRLKYGPILATFHQMWANACRCWPISEKIGRNSAPGPTCRHRLRNFWTTRRG